jgi:predicted NAD/FAD-dependent oxidoreductase
MARALRVGIVGAGMAGLACAEGLDWSLRHVDAAAAWVTARLIDAAAPLLGTPLPASYAESCHRWRYARSGAQGSGAIWDRQRQLGICGDWLIGPRVEAAWRSGTLLAQRIGHAERDLLVS